MIQKPLQKAYRSKNVQEEKKTWKKTLNNKIQRSISNEKLGNKDKMENEIPHKPWEEGLQKNEERCPEEEPFNRVLGIINSVHSASRGNMSNSFDTNMTEGSTVTSNQQQFDRFYGEAYADTLRKNIPNLEGLLKNSNISEGLRAKMIDWMLEVVNFFKPYSDIFTLFKAIVIMDLFFKHNQRSAINRLQDSDVHLIGLTSLFIASKYEDNRHISLRNLLNDACKNKFNTSQVLTTEWEILLSIGFNTSTPTHLECLDAILNTIFEEYNESTSNFYHQIRYLALSMIERSLYFADSSAVPMDQIALSCAIISIHASFDAEVVHRLATKQEIDELTTEKNYLIASLTTRFCETREKRDMLMTYAQMVRRWQEEGQVRFGMLGNWEKYFNNEQYLKDVRRERDNFNGTPH